MKATVRGYSESVNGFSIQVRRGAGSPFIRF